MWYRLSSWLVWMSRPFGEEVAHRISAEYAWHGRFMVLAWTIVLPAGILAARFFKVTRAQPWPQHLDNRLWWHWHLLLQVSGVLCMSIGVGIVWIKTGSTSLGRSLHASLGWLVVLLGWVQLLGGYLRGSKGGPAKTADGASDDANAQHGDHYDMTPRRILFEWMHKLGGYGAVALSWLVTLLGLEAAHAPVWMWLTIALWWAALGAFALRLQRAGRCIDTYQAIWGPDLRHPGNARRAIGWGVKRYSAPSK